MIDRERFMAGWQWANVLTLAIMGATMVGLYWAGAGGHSFWALLMLLNLGWPE